MLATPTLLWDHAAWKAVWDQLNDLLGTPGRLDGCVWLPTYIAALQAGFIVIGGCARCTLHSFGPVAPEGGTETINHCHDHLATTLIGHAFVAMQRSCAGIDSDLLCSWLQWWYSRRSRPIPLRHSCRLLFLRVEINWRAFLRIMLDEHRLYIITTWHS